MSETLRLDDNEIRFGQSVMGHGSVLAVFARGEMPSFVSAGLKAQLPPAASIETCQADADGGRRLQLLSGADGVLLVTSVVDKLDDRIRHQAGEAALFGPSQMMLLVTGAEDNASAKARVGALASEFTQLVEGLEGGPLHVVPVIGGEAGMQLPSWYDGPPLADVLAATLQASNEQAAALRAVAEDTDKPDQMVCRLLSGEIARGDSIKVLPGARQFEVTAVERQDDGRMLLTTATPHGSSAGNIVCAANDPVLVSDQFETNVVWFGQEPMLPGRQYVMQFMAGSTDGHLVNPKHVFNLETLEHLAAKTLEPGDIGVCNLSLDADVPFAPFRESRALGGFSIVDKLSGQLVGAGAINFALRRASNIHWQALDLNKGTRAGKLGQKPSVLWFTGLSGSGKSTIANLVEKKLYAMGHQTYLLDGDNVRHGLNRDLGFTDADRVENIRRVAEVARLMADAGLIVLASFISPFRSERRMARDMMAEGEFFEVFVQTPLEVCEQRDVKGLYVKARRGEIKNFTGIDSDYELPELADITLDTTRLDASESADEIIAHLERAGRLRA